MAKTQSKPKDVTPSFDWSTIANASKGLTAAPLKEYAWNNTNQVFNTNSATYTTSSVPISSSYIAADIAALK